MAARCDLESIFRMIWALRSVTALTVILGGLAWAADHPAVMSFNCALVHGNGFARKSCQIEMTGIVRGLIGRIPSLARPDPVREEVLPPGLPNIV
jgi:hypothetical protein